MHHNDEKALTYTTLPLETDAALIRVTVALADADNCDTPILDPAPEVRLLRDAPHAPFVELPIVSAFREKEEQ